MRNERLNSKSPFIAEVANKFSGNVFQSDYYPINFVAEDNFVFFRTLYDKPLGSTGANLASKAATWLYGPMRNPTRDFRGNMNAKYNQALSFLHAAANIEYIRETAFLQKYAAKHPEIKELIEKSKTDGPDKYLNLINTINQALKGEARYKLELDKEIKRIKTIKDVLENDAEALAEGRHVGVKKDSEDQKLTSEEYYERNKKVSRNSLGDSIFNPYYKFDGKRIFDSMFKENSDFVFIAEKIIHDYGLRLFDTSNNTMKLNKTQIVALTKVLIQEAYNILVIEFETQFKKNENEDKSIRFARISQALDQITKPGGHLDQFYKGIMESPDPATALDSIAKQNNIIMPDSALKKLGASTKIFNRRIKAMYEEEKRNSKTNLSYREWRKQKHLTESEVREYVYAMAHVKVQPHYTNEGMALTDGISKGFYGAVGGGKNAPTDVNLGMLVCTFSYEEYPEVIQRKAKEYINEAEQELSKAQFRALDQQQKITNKKSYTDNMDALRELADEQETILLDLKQRLEELGIAMDDMISNINIHETVKGYALIDNGKEQYFEGAAFGTKLTDQMDILNTMLVDGELTPLDTEWLTFALINCGNGMIGSDNKHALEDYLSGYVGLLMFSDASFISEDVMNYYRGNIGPSSSSNIHLYVLNDKYVPSSYILHETYKAMANFISGIEDAAHGTELHLKVYDSPNAYKTLETGASWKLETLSGPAWYDESKAALEATHLEMRFLRGFTSLLEQLRAQLP